VPIISRRRVQDIYGNQITTPSDQTSVVVTVMGRQVSSPGVWNPTAFVWVHNFSVTGVRTRPPKRGVAHVSPAG
jgi:hypothetical protein